MLKYTDSQTGEVVEKKETNLIPAEDIEFDKEAWAERRFRKLLQAIFSICDISGFHIKGRIVVEDLKTGKIWE